MGATVALMAQQGLDVVLCDLTNGEPTPHGTPETRAREAASAAEVLGVRRVTLTLPNRELRDTLEARRMLAASPTTRRSCTGISPCTCGCSRSRRSSST